MKTEITAPSDAPTEGAKILIELFHGEQEVRKIIDDLGNAWFCANDICDILGYTNITKTITDHCDGEGVTKRYTLTSGGRQEMIYINEPNLYSLVCSSKKAKAKEFKKWVFEVLAPSGVRGLPAQATTPAISEDRIAQLIEAAVCKRLAEVAAAEKPALPATASQLRRSSLFPHLWTLEPWDIMQEISTQELCRRLGCPQYTFERAMLAHGVLIQARTGVAFPDQHGKYGRNNWGNSLTSSFAYVPFWDVAIIGFLRENF